MLKHASSFVRLKTSMRSFRFTGPALRQQLPCGPSLPLVIAIQHIAPPIRSRLVHARAVETLGECQPAFVGTVLDLDAVVEAVAAVVRTDRVIHLEQPARFEPLCLSHFFVLFFFRRLASALETRKRGTAAGTKTGNRKHTYDGRGQTSNTCMGRGKPATHVARDNSAIQVRLSERTTLVRVRDPQFLYISISLPIVFYIY